MTNDLDRGSASRRRTCASSVWLRQRAFCATASSSSGRGRGSTGRTTGATRARRRSPDADPGRAWPAPLAAIEELRTGQDSGQRLANRRLEVAGLARRALIEGQRRFEILRRHRPAERAAPESRGSSTRIRLRRRGVAAGRRKRADGLGVSLRPARLNGPRISTAPTRTTRSSSAPGLNDPSTSSDSANVRAMNVTPILCGPASPSAECSGTDR